MKIPARRILSLVGLALMAASAAVAQPLTVDRAVEIGLQNSTLMARADAGVLDARSGVYGAYSGILPHVSASVARFNSVTTGARTPFGNVIIDEDAEVHGTTPGLQGSWNLFDITAISGWRAAQSGLKAAKLSHTSVTNDVVFSVRQEFYTTVGTYHLAMVAAASLRVARDNERRVRALFEVGSVSRSDLLQAQVRTAQAELDSLTAFANITDARLLLATAMGVPENTLGEVDTTMTAEAQALDETALQREAEANRPDLLAARASLTSAKQDRTAARWQRFPTLDASSTLLIEPNSRRTSTTNPPGLPPIIDPGIQATESETKQQWSGTLALRMNIFDGLGIESRNAAAEARLRRAQADLDNLERNLSAEVNQAVIQYAEAVERERVSARSFEAARENLNLTQQKYNVGSATILELVDSQVQATRAAANIVVARTGMKIAEAQVERVRGRGL